MHCGVCGATSTTSSWSGDGEFILTTSDRVAEALLPALDDLLIARAPHASLAVRTMTVDLAPFVSSDRITVLPRSFALARSRELGVVVRAPPFQLPAIEMEMAWHPGHERDPKHVWFREILRDAVRVAGLT